MQYVATNLLTLINGRNYQDNDIKTSKIFKDKIDANDIVRCLNETKPEKGMGSNKTLFD